MAEQPTASLRGYEAVLTVLAVDVLTAVMNYIVAAVTVVLMAIGPVLTVAGIGRHPDRLGRLSGA